MSPAAPVDVARLDRGRSGLGDAHDRALGCVIEAQHERLEIGDDLMNVFDDARDRLMLVHDTVDAESPHRGSAERRQKHAAHCVAKRVPEAALERLKPELGDVRCVLALGGFYQLRAYEPAEIDCVSHDVFLI